MHLDGAQALGLVAPEAGAPSVGRGQRHGDSSPKCASSARRGRFIICAYLALGLVSAWPGPGGRSPTLRASWARRASSSGTRCVSPRRRISRSPSRKSVRDAPRMQPGAAWRVSARLRRGHQRLRRGPAVLWSLGGLPCSPSQPSFPLPSPCWKGGSLLASPTSVDPDWSVLLADSGKNLQLGAREELASEKTAAKIACAQGHPLKGFSWSRRWKKACEKNKKKDTICIVHVSASVREVPTEPRSRAVLCMFEGVVVRLFHWTSGVACLT